jgi:hypothetical protein
LAKIALGKRAPQRDPDAHADLLLGDDPLEALRDTLDRGLRHLALRQLSAVGRLRSRRSLS